MKKRRTEMRLGFKTCFFQLLFFIIVGGSIALADEPAKRPQPSTDDALRNSLNSHSGDDYDRALLGEPKKDADNAAKDRGTEDPEKKSKQQNGPVTEQDNQQEDRLLQAVKGMRDVQARLAQGKSDAITQHVQRQVVADLQQIVDEAKKSGKCLGQAMAGNCNKPGKPGAGSSSQPKPIADNDQPSRESNPNANRAPKQPLTERGTVARDRMIEQYNKLELQTRQRETMLELPSEYFLPEYEREIEDYFRRLSSDKPAEDKPTVEQP
jgi:hypothetical protein